MKRTFCTLALLALVAASAFAQATKVISSSTLPTLCSAGAVYAKTGTAIGFYDCQGGIWLGPHVVAGPVTTSGLTMATARLLGRSTASTGAIEEITLGTNLSFSGTTLNATGGGSGTVTSIGLSGSDFTFTGSPVTTSGTIGITIAANAVTFAKLAQGSALSVLGVAGNATADQASIVAGSDKQVLRRSGTAIGFGAIDLTSSAAVTGILPIANIATGTPTGLKFVRDDGVLATPAGSGNVTTSETLTNLVSLVGNGTTDLKKSTLTASVVKYTTGTPSAATDGMDYLSPATGMTRLAQIVTSGSQATVDFTSISGAYSSLLVTWIAQDTTAGTSASAVYVKANNDGTSGNYTASAAAGTTNGTTAAGFTVAATANGAFVNDMPNAGNTSIAGAGQLLIAGYAGTTFHKTLLSTYGSESTSFNEVVAVRGRWKSTAAITRLTFAAGTAFTNGSVYTLYGIP